MTTTINRATLSQGNRIWLDDWSALVARRQTVLQELGKFTNADSLTNQQLRIELIKTEQVMFAHRLMANRLAVNGVAGYFELWQATEASKPPTRLDESIGDFRYCNLPGSEPVPNAQTSTGQARLLQQEMQQDFLAFTQRVNEAWSDNGKIAQKLIVDTGRKGSEMAIDFVFSKIGMPTPATVVRSVPGVPSFGTNKDFVVDNLFDEMLWKPLGGSLGERIIKEWNQLWFGAPKKKDAPSFLGPSSSLTPDNLSYALIEAADAWVKLADGSDSATPDALAANIQLRTDIKAALAPYDLATAQVITGDNGVAIEFAGNRRLALDRSGSWSLSSVIEQSDGSGLVVTTLDDGSRHEVRVGNDLVIQEAWYDSSGAQTYGLSYQMGGVDTGATVFAGGTSFRLSTGSDGTLSSFGAVSGLITTPTNPTIFDLSVDTTGLRPGVSSGLGSNGLLEAGSAYTASMAKQYVDQSGLTNTVASALATDMIRPGNHSLSQTGAIMDALRANAASFRESTLAQMGGNLIEVVSQPAGTATSKIQTDIHRYVSQDGVTYQSQAFAAEVYFDAQGTMIGLRPLQTVALEVRDGSGQIIHTENLTGDTRYAPQTTSGSTASGWSASGLQPDNSDEVLLIRAVANETPYTDPLTLDANNDGVRLSASPVNFDLNADGVAEALPWTAPTDPLLVMDVNGNGRIDNGRELLDLTNADAPLNLLTLDDNGDKTLDANDAAWWTLELWSDRNQDGYASVEERQSLSDIGIVSIDLDPAHLQTGTVAGQTGVKGVVATYSDAHTRTLWDVPLTPSSTATSTSTAYAAGIDKVSGSGQTALVARSALGVAINLSGSGADQAIGGQGNDTLTGTTGDDWLTGGAGSDKFAGGAGADLLVIDADDRQANIDGGSGIDTVLVADDRGVLLNLAQANVEVVYGGYGNDVFIGGGADNYFIAGAAGDDLIIGGSADDVLSGEDGDDVIEGGQGDDLIRGHRGQDQLFGGDGNDVLDGGLDNDLVNGEAGNDVIVASGGTDTVDGGAGTDLIELQEQLEDYSFVNNGNGNYTITDHKNADGSAVAAGKVSDRDGVQIIKNVEKFSFLRGQTPTAVDRPWPVNGQWDKSRAA